MDAACDGLLVCKTNLLYYCNGDSVQFIRTPLVMDTWFVKLTTCAALMGTLSSIGAEVVRLERQRALYGFLFLLLSKHSKKHVLR